MASQKTFSTKIVIAIIIVVMIAIPTYLGIVAGIVAVHGTKYIEMCLFNPEFTYVQAKRLLTWWLDNSSRIQLDYTAKMLGPPVGGFVMGIMLVYFMRAPLIDFRPGVKKKESLHGDATWATEADIRKAGLRAKKGMLLGRTGKNNYLIGDDYQHALLFAPTGSGKGVGFVIPNLLFWEDSVICHDIKMENWELTSGYREKKMGHSVYLWNPADPDGFTHCYNPLDWISDKPGQMVDDVQKICNLILPEQEFWQNEARSLLLGVILYLCAVPDKLCSFGEVVRTMRSDDVVYSLAVVLDTIGKKIHPVSYMNIAAFLQKADKERSGVVSTLNSGLELWANPLIDAATATSDFDIQQMKKKKMTVFCGVTPDNLQRLEPLLKVFYQQCADFLTRKMPGKEEPYGVLFMMDEFPTLGEMKMFQTGIAYFRGYRVKLFLIVQDTQQLKGIYEDAGMNSFLSNSFYRITFSANNVETAELISKMVGNKTVKQHSQNKPKFLDFNPASRTINESEAQRALLLPQEVITLPRDEQIILIESSPPIRTRKIFFYEDPFFIARAYNKKNPRQGGPPPCYVPTQEPYDPRKKNKAAAPPEPIPASEPAPAPMPEPLPVAPEPQIASSLPAQPPVPAPKPPAPSEA